MWPFPGTENKRGRAKFGEPKTDHNFDNLIKFNFIQPTKT